MRCLRPFGIMVVIFFAACHRGGTPDKDSVSMNTIPLHTICIGRLLADLPKNGFDYWSQDFDVADVSRLPSNIKSQEDFWKEVEEKEKFLRSLPHKTEHTQLGVYEKIGNNAAVLMFRDSDTFTDGYKMDRYLWLGAWGYLFKTGDWPNEIKSEVPRYSKIFGHMMPVDNSAVVASGFCIDGAVISDDFGRIGVGITTRDFGWKGVTVSVGTLERVEPSEPYDAPLETPFDALIQAEKEKENMKGPATEDVQSFKVLLKQARMAAGFEGQATAYRVIFNNGRFEYHFNWEAKYDNAVPPARPRIAVDLTFLDQGPNEIPRVTPPSEEQMFALWNAVLNSVRMRPGALDGR